MATLKQPNRNGRATRKRFDEHFDSQVRAIDQVCDKGNKLSFSAGVPQRRDVRPYAPPARLNVGAAGAANSIRPAEHARSTPPGRPRPSNVALPVVDLAGAFPFWASASRRYRSPIGCATI